MSLSNNLTFALPFNKLFFAPKHRHSSSISKKDSFSSSTLYIVEKVCKILSFEKDDQKYPQIN